MVRSLADRTFQLRRIQDLGRVCRGNVSVADCRHRGHREMEGPQVVSAERHAVVKIVVEHLIGHPGHIVAILESYRYLHGDKFGKRRDNLNFFGARHALNVG